MRSLKKIGLLAAAFLVVGSGSARASTIEVKVPFSFVIHGQTLPAGQYRVSDDSGVVQFLGEKGNKASMFVMTMPASGPWPGLPSLLQPRPTALRNRTSSSLLHCLRL